MERRTKIVATIGPASRDPDVLARMIEAGMDVARLNFSHGSREIHAENAERVRAAANAAGRQVAILQDLPGPKLRIGALEDAATAAAYRRGSRRKRSSMYELITAKHRQRSTSACDPNALTSTSRRPRVRRR